MDTAGTVRVTINSPVKFAVADYQNYINTFMVVPPKHLPHVNVNDFGEMLSVSNCGERKNNNSNSTSNNVCNTTNKTSNNTRK